MVDYGISVFDLDHTLLKANSSYCFGAYLFRLKFFSLPSLFYSVGCYGLHKMGRLSLQNLHQRLFDHLFKGRSASRVQAFAEQFIAEKLPHLLYEPAFKRLSEAIQEGHRTLLLSSSPDFLVAPIARYLKVDEWAATPYQLDSQQSFCSLGSVLSGEGKRHYVKALSQRGQVPLEAVYAYSDSHLDLPLLEIAGHPVGVNPDRRLRSICQRRGWKII